MQREIRKDFPFFDNSNLVFLDSASTTQKPRAVIEKTTEYYTYSNANANRGSYSLALESSRILENTRIKVAKFIGTKDSDTIVFTKGATEALNLVAFSLGSKLNKGDEILISVLEHHANLVVWQQVASLTGATLKYFYLTDNLEYDLEDLKQKLNQSTKILAFSGASNVLSFDVPIKQICELGKSVGAITIVDGAQLIAHKKVDVEDLGCDFFAFSAHKMFANQGVGILYGRKELLDSMSPFLFGGDMIEYVQEQSSTFTSTPHKFEAGSQNIEGANSLSTAIDYIESIGFDTIQKIETELIEYALSELRKLDFIKLYVPQNLSGSCIIFTFDGVHPHDVSQILDFNSVAIRVGHHCTQVLHRYLGINSSCRVSVSIYNTKQDIDRLIQELHKVREVFYGD